MNLLHIKPVLGMMQSIIPFAPGSTLPVVPQVPNFAQLIDQLLQTLKSMAPVENALSQTPPNEIASAPEQSVEEEFPEDGDGETMMFEEEEFSAEARVRQSQQPPSQDPVVRSSEKPAADPARPVQAAPVRIPEKSVDAKPEMPAEQDLALMRLLTPQILPMDSVPVDATAVPGTPAPMPVVTSIPDLTVPVTTSAPPSPLSESIPEAVTAGQPVSSNAGQFQDIASSFPMGSVVPVAVPEAGSAPVAVPQPSVTRDPFAPSVPSDAPTGLPAEAPNPSGAEIQPDASGTNSFQSSPDMDDGTERMPGMNVAAPEPSSGTPESAPPPMAPGMEHVLSIEIEKPSVTNGTPVSPDRSAPLSDMPDADAVSPPVPEGMPEVASADPVRQPIRFVSLSTEGETRVSIQDRDGLAVPRTAVAGKASARIASFTNTPPAPSTDIVDRIVRAARLTEVRGQTKIKIVLNPPHLGTLRVNLVVKDHVLHGTLQTETSAARELILSNLHQLKESLEEQGIRMGEFHILSEQAQDQPHSRAGHESREARDEQPVFFSEDRAEGEESEPRRKSVSNRLQQIDVLA